MAYFDQAGTLIFRRWMLPRLICFIFAGLLAGCMSTIKYGSPPRVKHLETLEVGISKEADVLFSLGEPRGNGTVLLSTALPPRKIWFYEYTETSGRRIDLMILLVFFDKELYDGHLWFSSALLLEKEK